MVNASLTGAPLTKAAPTAPSGNLVFGIGANSSNISRIAFDSILALSTSRPVPLDYCFLSTSPDMIPSLVDPPLLNIGLFKVLDINFVL